MNKQNLKASLISAIVVLCVASIGGYMWYLFIDDIPVENPAEIPVVEEVEEPQVNPSVTTTTTEQEEVAIVVSEKFMPVMIEGKVVRPFYSLSKSQQEQIDAIIEYDGVYRSNYGVDYASNNGNVVALASCEVREVSKDTLFGNKIVLACGKYMVTYQSLDEIFVKAGQSVKQGVVLGSAGENIYDSSLGKHVHVIVEMNGKYFDLEKLIKDKESIS